jgi:hypothetical protein
MRTTELRQPAGPYEPGTYPSGLRRLRPGAYRIDEPATGETIARYIANAHGVAWASYPTGSRLSDVLEELERGRLELVQIVAP